MSSFLQTIPSSMLVRGDTLGEPSEDSREDFLDPSPLRSPSGERSLFTAESLDELRFFIVNLTFPPEGGFASGSSEVLVVAVFTESFFRPRSSSAEDIVLLKNLDVFHPAALLGFDLPLSPSEELVVGLTAVESTTILLEVSRRVSLTLKLDGCEALLLSGSATTTVLSGMTAERRGLDEPRRSSRDGDRARSSASSPACGTDICRTAAMARCATSTRWSLQEQTSFSGLASFTRILGNRVPAALKRWHGSSQRDVSHCSVAHEANISASQAAGRPRAHTATDGEAFVLGPTPSFLRSGENWWHEPMNFCVEQPVSL